MVVLPGSYLQKIKFKAIIEALNYKTPSKTLRSFVDDSHPHFQERSHTGESGLVG